MHEFRHGAARFIFTDRSGGRSLPPYDSNNLGDHVGDDPNSVAQNRRSLAWALNVPEIRFAEQRHTADVATANPGMDASCSVAADAFVVSQSGIAAAMMVADCMPIGIATEAGRCLAVVHAGWRGLVEGVLQQTIAMLREAESRCASTATPAGFESSDPARWYAVIGPCARPETSELGEADVERAAAILGEHVRSRTTTGSCSIDLPAGARHILEQSGIGTIHDIKINTMSDNRYFSYRREGATGRQAIVGLRSDSLETS